MLTLGHSMKNSSRRRHSINSWAGFINSHSQVGKGPARQLYCSYICTEIVGNTLHAIDIQVNDWNLHYILGDLTFKQAQSDFKYTENENRIFDFVWAVFLCFCMVRSIREDIDQLLAGDRAIIQNDQFIKPKYFSEQFEKSRRLYSELFILSVEFVKYSFNMQ